jgi:hypothetical protein
MMTFVYKIIGLAGPLDQITIERYEVSESRFAYRGKGAWFPRSTKGLYTSVRDVEQVITDERTRRLLKARREVYNLEKRTEIDFVDPKGQLFLKRIWRR